MIWWSQLPGKNRIAALSLPLLFPLIMFPVYSYRLLVSLLLPPAAVPPSLSFCPSILFQLFPLPLFPSLSINASMGKSEPARYYCQHTGRTFQPRMSQTCTADIFVYLHSCFLCYLMLNMELVVLRDSQLELFFTYLSRARPKSLPSSTAAATWGRSGQFSGCSGPAYWRRALPWLREV